MILARAMAAATAAFLASTAGAGVSVAMSPDCAAAFLALARAIAAATAAFLASTAGAGVSVAVSVASL